MKTNVRRFLKFVEREEEHGVLAFIICISFIAAYIESFPLALQIPCMIIRYIIIVRYTDKWLEKTFIENGERLGEKFIQEIKKITKEIIMYIPVYITAIIITSLIMVGEPVNQTNVAQAFYDNPITMGMNIIVIGPMIEEFTFRFLPYRCIKNKTIYVIVSTVIFGAMHVTIDTNPLYYIWFYMLKPLYYGYRYHKTQDIWVPISMHSFGNLIGVLSLIFS